MCGGAWEQRTELGGIAGPPDARQAKAACENKGYAVNVTGHSAQPLSGQVSSRGLTR